jgi:hypothetical protein
VGEVPKEVDNAVAEFLALVVVGSAALERPQPDERMTMNLDIYASDYRKNG